MSTNVNCLFIEIEPAKWYYILEDYNAPKNSWDWREYASATGPFKTEETAHTHLRNNHCNPGGSGVQEYKEPIDLEKDTVLKELIEKAEDPNKPRHTFFTAKYPFPR